MVGGKQQPPVRPVFALPIIDPAVYQSCVRFRRMRPDLSAGGRIQRDDGIILGENVYDSVNNDRVERVRLIVAGWETPSDLKLRNVGSIDLSKRGILRRIGRASVIAPGLVILRYQMWRGNQQRGERREEE